MAAVISGELLGLFSKYIEDHLGLYFPKEREGDLARTLRSASAGLGFKDPEACIRFFLLAPAGRGQIEALAGYLTVGETYFFREEKTFDVLKEHILPELIRWRRESGRHLSIWSAGCATGEEPYSVAILLHSMLPDFREWDINILATDINPHFLKKAARGVYGEWSFRNAPPMFRNRYFRNAAKGRFELLPHIRERVTFRYHNLAGGTTPPLANGIGAMDIIFCRNVLMYFSRKVQEEVVRKFHASLVEGGWLAVSPVEMPANLFPAFIRSDSPGVSLYKKVRKDASLKNENGEPSAAQTGVPFAGDNHGEVSAGEGPVYGHEARISQETELNGLPAIGPKEEPEGEAAAPQPSDQTAPYQNAMALYREGRYVEAGEEAARLLSGENILSSPDNGKRVFKLLVHIYAAQGRLDDALEMCGKAISCDKLDPGTYYLLAVIQQEMGRSEESAATLKRIVYLDPGFVLAYFFLGDLARRQGKMDESRKQFNNALSAMSRYGQADLVPGSEGLTVGRLIEIINNNIREMAEV